MMQIHPAKTINPKSLRALQVDTAIEYGISLNDTPRVSRGHRDRALSSPEWRAEQRDERRERSPTRQVYAKTASSFADDAIGREANELKKLSDRYRKADTPERREEAKALEKAAFILSSGGTLDDAPHKTVDEPQREKQRPQDRQVQPPEPQATRKPQIPSRDDVYGLSDRVSGMRTDKNEQNQRAHAQPRRLTEAELRDVLAAKERELAKTDRAVALDQKTMPSRSDSIPSDAQGRTMDRPETRNRDGSADHTAIETQPDSSGRKKPLTEQELRALLSAGVKELTEAEKRRDKTRSPPKKDNGLDFGFD